MIAELIRVDEIIRHFKFSFSLEEYLRQLSRNCRIWNYELKPSFSGSEGCTIALKPKRDFISLQKRDFDPNIVMEIQNGEGMLEVTVICSPPKRIRPFILLFASILILMAILMICAVFSGRLEPYVVLVPCVLLVVLLLLFPLTVRRVLRHLMPAEEDLTW